MKDLKQLLAGLSAANEQVSAAKRALTVYLQPILEAATGKKLEHATVEDAWFERDDVRVNINVSFRPPTGEPWGNQYHLPFQVLDAVDPVQAARDLKAEYDRREREGSLLRKRLMLKKLKTELGES